MIRVLQIVNIMDRAGLENMIMNYYRNIDRTKVQFDFLTHRPEEGAYDEEIKALGGRVYRAPRLYPQNYPAYFKFMKQFFAEHPEYKIVHSHIDVMSYLPLLAAKRAGVPVRIAHSHCKAVDRDFKYLLKQFFRTQVNSVTTERYACSSDAGKFLYYNHDFTVIPNAINIEKFVYNEKIRKEKRRELCLEDCFVIGHVGRFTGLKNHNFLIQVFEKVSNKNDKARLLLVGAGELKEKIELQIQEKKLDNKVIILTNRDDVNELYQAMDVFAFPSLAEGLGLVAVEAQVSGLPCVLSDRVPSEAKISEKVEFLELNEDVWVDALQEAMNTSGRKEVYNAFYDINSAANNLMEKYITLYEKN